MQVGDVLISIDGKEAINCSREDLQSWIPGRQNTSVKLTLQSQSSVIEYDVTAQRHVPIAT